jgi:hypothetical protein
VESGTSQVPAVPVATTQRAGVRQPGPASTSHAALSAAGATQTSEPAASFLQLPPEVQTESVVLVFPQTCPAVTKVSATQVCTGAAAVPVLMQPRPMPALHSGAVTRSGSQVPPTVVTSA